MTSAIGSLIDLLRPDRITTVVDIGANPIDGNPPYKPMLQRRLCRLIGFEPQLEALAKLNSRKSDLELYLSYAVGDGTEGRLRVCQARGMTSLFEPDKNTLKYFPKFSEWGKVLKELPITTRRLDDIEEISAIDFLKIDIQGSGQPVFGDIDLELRKLGFVPHAFAAINKRLIAPLAAKDPYTAINQLVEADVVYVRDFTKPDEMDTEQLKHLAVIAHHCYQSYDLAMNCIHHLAERGAIQEAVIGQYLSLTQTRKN